MINVYIDVKTNYDDMRLWLRENAKHVDIVPLPTPIDWERHLIFNDELAALEFMLKFGPNVKLVVGKVE